MSSPGHSHEEALAELRHGLRRVALRLWLRQLGRALPVIVAGACGSVIAAQLLLVWLALLLFGGPLLSPLLAGGVAACVGALFSAVWAVRTVRVPGSREAALVMESRLDTSDASLATALEATGPFVGPVLARARQEMIAAFKASAPPLLATRVLVGVPVLLIAAIALTVLGLDLRPASIDGTVRPDTPVVRGGLAAVDVGGSRGAADAQALAEAAGMRQAANDLSKAATALRQAGTDAEAGRALEDGRAALAGIKPEQRPNLELPSTVPQAPDARARLADEMAAAAGAITRRTEAVIGKGSGAEGGGSNPGDVASPQDFVAVPRAGPPQIVPGEAVALVGQNPARRALVARASR